MEFLQSLSNHLLYHQRSSNCDISQQKLLVESIYGLMKDMMDRLLKHLPPRVKVISGVNVDTTVTFFVPVYCWVGFNTCINYPPVNQLLFESHFEQNCVSLESPLPKKCSENNETIDSAPRESVLIDCPEHKHIVNDLQYYPELLELEVAVSFGKQTHLLKYTSTHILIIYFFINSVAQSCFFIPFSSKLSYDGIQIWRCVLVSFQSIVQYFFHFSLQLFLFEFVYSVFYFIYILGIEEIINYTSVPLC